MASRPNRPTLTVSEVDNFEKKLRRKLEENDPLKCNDRRCYYEKGSYGAKHKDATSPPKSNFDERLRDKIHAANNNDNDQVTSTRRGSVIQTAVNNGSSNLEERIRRRIESKEKEKSTAKKRSGRPKVMRHCFTTIRTAPEPLDPKPIKQEYSDTSTPKNSSAVEHSGQDHFEKLREKEERDSNFNLRRSAICHQSLGPFTDTSKKLNYLDTVWSSSNMDVPLEELFWEYSVCATTNEPIDDNPRTHCSFCESPREQDAFAQSPPPPQMIDNNDQHCIDKHACLAGTQEKHSGYVSWRDLGGAIEQAAFESLEMTSWNCKACHYKNIDCDANFCGKCGSRRLT